MSCGRCGGDFDVEVWDLGHKDSDSIACPCCGVTLHEWSKEARSYAVRGVTKHGNIFTAEAISRLVGKRIRAQKGNKLYHGKVKGRHEMPMAAGAQKLVFPMVIETDHEAVIIAPSDGWRVCLCQT